MFLLLYVYLIWNIITNYHLSVIELQFISYSLFISYSSGAGRCEKQIIWCLVKISLQVQRFSVLFPVEGTWMHSEASRMTVFIYVYIHICAYVPLYIYYNIYTHTYIYIKVEEWRTS